MLSKLQLARVCMANQGHSQCRYLDGSQQGNWVCLKLSPKKTIIDEEVSNHYKEAKKQGINPNKQGFPLGDGGGCQGYVVLKSKLQGYDVP